MFYATEVILLWTALYNVSTYNDSQTTRNCQAECPLRLRLCGDRVTPDLVISGLQKIKSFLEKLKSASVQQLMRHNYHWLSMLTPRRFVSGQSCLTSTIQ
jgi:hypothetical protein